MVECKVSFDRVFQALADSTRRDILKRVSQKELSIGALASCYHMSFAAVAKHITVLEQAELVGKHRRGKERLVRLRPHTVEAAQSHLREYEKLWQRRFDQLDQFLSSNK